MLYIVATPIGNLEDITFRAVETLKSVDKIYCEDTRHSHLLLDRYGIETPTESLHQHTNPDKLQRIVNSLKNDVDAAYISDAGTPGISDPGGVLVEKAKEAGVKVVPIPGPSAVTALLSASGLR